jgi:ectoine hydroxylase-related dioxygenase (phytanoyl-CoA dioxygenase family)
VISSSDVEQFQRDGFLIVAGVFSRAEIARFRGVVDAALERRGEKPPDMGHRDAYDRMFTQYYNLWEDSAEVRALTFDSRIAQIASTLAGARSMRVYCDQTFYKEPGSSPTGVHQDYPLLSIAETATISAWIPLSKYSLAGGAIGYVPGSHRFGAFSHVDVAMGRDPMSDPNLREAVKKPVYCELPPGSVAFHHVLTFHLAAANTSNRTRKAFVVTYVADGSTRGTSWPHASVDRGGIGVGDLIGGPATPIAWPPPRDLPAPPPPNPNPPRGWPGRAGP